MSIQYTVLGFEPRAFGTWVSSHNHSTRAPAQYSCFSVWWFWFSSFKCSIQKEPIFLLCRIQSSQTGDQPYSDTSPYNVNQCFSVRPNLWDVLSSSTGIRTLAVWVKRHRTNPSRGSVKFGTWLSCQDNKRRNIQILLRFFSLLFYLSTSTRCPIMIIVITFSRAVCCLF